MLAKRFGVSTDVILKILRKHDEIHTQVCGTPEGIACEERGLRDERPQARTTHSGPDETDADTGRAGLRVRTAGSTKGAAVPDNKLRPVHPWNR